MLLKVVVDIFIAFACRVSALVILVTAKECQLDVTQVLVLKLVLLRLKTD